MQKDNNRIDSPPVALARFFKSEGSVPSRSSLLRTGSVGSSVIAQTIPQEIRPAIPPNANRSSTSLLDDVLMDEESEEGLSFASVVKVFATIQEPNYICPWQSKEIENSSGSGVAIRTSSGSMRILTAAHVVADQTFVQVQRLGVEKPDKYVATVYAVSHDCDLALLSVEDTSEFWKELEPAELGRIPRRRSVVLVAGFPVGGEELSITEGVVSRIEGQRYSQSQRRLLAVTVDAAINQGNSGGPAFNAKGQLIGIAFQGLEGASNIGHIVPPPVIEHFLDGLASSGPQGYLGFPHSGIKWQQLTNPHLRKHYQLEDDVHGVLLTTTWYGNTCHGVLQPRDVLTHINEQAVANNGTVTYDKHGRIDLNTAFTMFQCGTTIDLHIVRDGKPTTVQVTTKPYQRLVPLSQHDCRPPYFVYCGLVFQPLSLNYMDSFVWRSIFAVGDPHSHLLWEGKQSEDRIQVVLLTQTLSDEINVGYEEFRDEEIKKVNGHSVRDLKDLIEKVESTTDPIVCFETGHGDKVIVPSPANARDANERILSLYNIGSDRCVDGERC